jgi:hypothetical protein
MNNPQFKEVREIVLPMINKFIGMPEAMFRATIFQYLDGLDDEGAKSLSFILLMLLRQSFGVVNNGN